MAGDNGMNRPPLTHTCRIQNSIGAIIAAVVICVALLVLYRWELVASGDGMATNGVYRLDR
jgi:hypothetical protein